MLYQFFEAGFVNGNPAGLERGHLADVIVHTDDVMADVRETRVRDQPHVTSANNAEFHMFMIGVDVG